MLLTLKLLHDYGAGVVWRFGPVAGSMLAGGVSEENSESASLLTFRKAAYRRESESIQYGNTRVEESLRDASPISAP